MGWWGSGILEGDTPLDYLAEIEKILGVSDLYPLEGWDDKKRARVLIAVEKLTDFDLGKICAGRRYESEVFVQTLACVIMASGAPMSKVFRDAAVKAGSDDGWMKEEGSESSRGTSIRNFMGAIREYEDGKPTVIDSKGLFQSIGEFLEGGEKE
jgi:hypothetical protein